MLNQVALMGRLVEDPKTYEGKENTLSTFTLAVNEGEERTSFFDCKLFGKDAVVAYLNKGDKIGIAGRLSQEKYETKDGNKRSAVVIIVNNIEFADVKALPSEEVAREENTAKSEPVAKPKRIR